jgi:predicted transposase YbfD/YdcC
MSIIKIKKSANYTVIDNAPIKDPNLGWQHKGLLTFLMSLPDDWTIRKTELCRHAKNGRDSTIKTFNQLIEFGYINQIPTEGTKFGFDYIVSDIPFLNFSNGKPVTENKKLLSKEKQSKENKLYNKSEEAENDFQIIETDNVKIKTENQNKKSSAKKSIENKIVEILTPTNGNYFQFQTAFQELSKRPGNDANGFPQFWTDELKLAFIDWAALFCLVKKNRWGFRPQIVDEFKQINEYLLTYSPEEISDCLIYAKSKSNSNYKPEWTLRKIEKKNKTKSKSSNKRADNYDAVRDQLSDPNFLS